MGERKRNPNGFIRERGCLKAFLRVKVTGANYCIRRSSAYCELLQIRDPRRQAWGSLSGKVKSVHGMKIGGDWAEGPELGWGVA